MKYLYVITNSVNRKQYVGVSKHPQKRFKKHFRLNNGSVLLYQAGKKYGKENFELTIICKGEDEFIFDLEILTIKEWNTQTPNGYNIAPGGERGPDNIGRKHSDAAKQKIRLAHIGRKVSIEGRRNMSNARKGVKLSEEHKQNIGRAVKGRKHSEAARKRMSIAQKGSKHTEKTKEKMREAKRGMYFGSESPSAKKVMVEGKIYGSMVEAAKAIGINAQTLYCSFQRYRKTNRYPAGWAEFDGDKQIPNNLRIKRIPILKKFWSLGLSTKK